MRTSSRRQSIEADVNQFTTFVTLGVTDRFDVSVAVPVVVELPESGLLGRAHPASRHDQPLTHFFRQSDGDGRRRRLFTAVGQASGIGDLMVRLKTARAPAAVERDSRSALDIRLPTGDEMNLLGTGAAGVQPFAIWSATVRPGVAARDGSYQWNGSSVLAGNPATGESGRFPDQVGLRRRRGHRRPPRLTWPSTCSAAT